MWKAHETGLAVTQSTSKQSLLYRREVSYHRSQVEKKMSSPNASNAQYCLWYFLWAWQGMHSCGN
jgi:hypothetical protein